jgi:hypothetical protein
VAIDDWRLPIHDAAETYNHLGRVKSETPRTENKKTRTLWKVCCCQNYLMITFCMVSGKSQAIGFKAS